MSETNHKKFAVDTMIGVAKLLVTLASGFIVLSVTLLGQLSGETDPISHFWIIVVCWFTLIVSIGCGILSLGSIATSAHDHSKFDVDDRMTKWLLRVQQLSFVLSFILFVIYAWVNK